MEAALCLCGLVVVLVPQVFGLAAPTAGCVEPRPLSLGDPLGGELTLRCPEQWFDMRLDEPQRVILAVRSGFDGYLELFEGDGETLLDEDDDSGLGYNPFLTSFLPAGSYRLRLRPYRSDTGPYLISLE